MNFLLLLLFFWVGGLWAGLADDMKMGMEPGDDGEGSRVFKPEVRPLGLPQSEVERHAAAIDRLVGSEIGLKLDDDTFLRRIYLDSIGRIPSLDEREAFYADAVKGRRERLINELLNSAGYVSRQFNFWADLLRVQTRMRRASGVPYIRWLKGSLAENKAYDQMVRELVAAEGSIWENGAASYAVRDANMQEDHLAITTRVFLGTRLECAQCHDHPFDRWKQKEFFEMLAFNGGTRTERPGHEELKRMAKRLRRDPKNPELGRSLKYLSNIYSPGTFGSGSGKVRLPDTVAAGTGQPKAIVVARAIFGPPVKTRDFEKSKKLNGSLHSRLAFADWITSPDNPRFAMVMANRLWKQAFGRGLIEPVDDIRDDSMASHPALMQHLGNLLHELDYDLKAYLCILYNTRTYQQPVVDGMSQTLAPVLRRMSAEQAWDSVLSIMVPDLDERGLDDTFERDRRFYHKMVNSPVDEKDLLAMATEHHEGLKAEREAAGKERQGTQKKARLRKEIREKMTEAKGRKEIQKLKKSLAGKGLQETSLVRASELASPVDPNHPMLHLFGQSQREVADDADSSSSVPQALMLMNSPLIEKLVNDPASVLGERIRSEQGGVEQKIELLFASILGRRPVAEEVAMVKSTMKDSQALQAARNLASALITSNEFIFIQ